MDEQIVIEINLLIFILRFVELIDQSVGRGGEGRRGRGVGVDQVVDGWERLKSRLRADKDVQARLRASGI